MASLLPLGPVIISLLCSLFLFSPHHYKSRSCLGWVWETVGLPIWLNIHEYIITPCYDIIMTGVMQIKEGLIDPLLAMFYQTVDIIWSKVMGVVGRVTRSIKGVWGFVWEAVDVMKELLMMLIGAGGDKEGDDDDEVVLRRPTVSTNTGGGASNGRPPLFPSPSSSPSSSSVTTPTAAANRILQ